MDDTDEEAIGLLVEELIDDESLVDLAKLCDLFRLLVAVPTLCESVSLLSRVSEVGSVYETLA